MTGYESFVGRTKELQTIDHLFRKINTVIVTGCAGIGKSSLLIEYGKLNKKKFLVRYFNAESKNKIDQQYRELAALLNLYKLDQSYT